MRLRTSWQEKMQFVATADEHRVSMDAKAPVGGYAAMTPKQLLLAAICGCTGMDVIALLRKYKQPFSGLQIDAEAEVTQGVYPAIFTDVKLYFKIQGEVAREKVLEAVQLSQTKFCGVSAMVAKAVPIHYTVFLNGHEIGTGEAKF